MNSNSKMIEEECFYREDKQKYAFESLHILKHSYKSMEQNHRTSTKSNIFWLEESSVMDQASVALLSPWSVGKCSKSTYLLFSQAEHSQLLSVSEYEQQRLQTL